MMIFPIFCSFSNVYLVKNCGKYILIDAGLPWDENRILRFLRKETLRLDLIFITHAHPDHYGCSRSIHEITKAPIAIHHQDECLLRSGKISLGETKGIGTIVNTPSSVFNKISTFKSPDPNLLLHDGDTLESLGIEAEIIHTPGHTPGSSTLLFSDGSAFVGDLASSSGHPHLQRYFAQDWSLLTSSTQKVNNKRPQKIFPGHGIKMIEGNFLDQYTN